jgi:hypothetical protein
MKDERELRSVAILIAVAILIPIVAAILVAWVTKGSFSEVTTYPALCSEELKGGKCQGSLIPLNRSIYKISVERQDVIYWTVGLKLPPSRLTDCVVRDRRNWSCKKYSDGSGELLMIDGKFATESSYNDTLYLGKWRWWLLNITGKTHVF